MPGQKHIILYAARHGSTTENDENVFRGNTDPSLDKHGFRDANELAFYLKPIDFSYVFTTGKKRTEQTADIVLRDRDIPRISNEGLFPWNTGVFAGQPKNAENKKKLQFFIENPDTKIPEGESLNEFRSRVGPLLMEAIEYGFDNENPILMILHSSVIHTLGEVAGDHHEDGHVKPGGVAVVYIQDGKLGVQPIFKPDERATSQNVLGSVNRRSSLNS